MEVDFVLCNCAADYWRKRREREEGRKRENPRRANCFLEVVVERRREEKTALYLVFSACCSIARISLDLVNS